MNLFSSIGVFTKIPVVLIATGFLLFACVNDLETIQKVNDNPNTPDETSTDLNLHYTDSGYARVQIYAKLAETQNLPEKITKLKEKVRVNFFSSKGEIISTLTSKYGEVNHETGLMFVRDSVILRNLEKKQWLETEELFYNQIDSSIYTNKYVIVKRQGKGVIGKGKGIKTNQFFYQGIITNPEGDIYFD